MLECDLAIPEPAFSHNRALLRDMPVISLPYVTYTKPEVIASVTAVDESESLPAGCADHPDATMIPFSTVEASYHAWERFVYAQCGHEGCGKNVCLRINLHAGQTGRPFHTVGVSREMDVQTTHEGKKVPAYASEPILVFPADTELTVA